MKADSFGSLIDVKNDKFWLPPNNPILFMIGYYEKLSNNKEKNESVKKVINGFVKVRERFVPD